MAPSSGMPRQHIILHQHRLRGSNRLISKHHDSSLLVSNRPLGPRSRGGMREIGCGVTKICLLLSKSAPCKTIQASAVCPRNSNSNTGSGWSISPTCLRSNSCAC